MTQRCTQATALCASATRLGAGLRASVPEHAGLFWLAGHQLAIPGLTLPTACLDIVTSALADPRHAVLAPSHVDGWASCCLHSAFQHTVPETPVKASKRLCQRWELTQGPKEFADLCPWPLG